MYFNIKFDDVETNENYKKSFNTTNQLEKWKYFWNNILLILFKNI